MNIFFLFKIPLREKGKKNDNELMSYIIYGLHFEGFSVTDFGISAGAEALKDELVYAHM